jgi:hypothetical protein
VNLRRRDLPEVAAVRRREILVPPSISCRSLTETFGSVPSRVHVPPCRFDETTTPTSVATTSLWLAVITRSSPGMSGKLPLMSIHDEPAFVDSYTWPSPAENVFVHRRERPLNTT